VQSELLDRLNLWQTCPVHIALSATVTCWTQFVRRNKNPFGVIGVTILSRLASKSQRYTEQPETDSSQSTLIITFLLSYMRVTSLYKHPHLHSGFIWYSKRSSGSGSSVGIATGYGLEGPGIESRWGEIFCTCPDRPWGPPSLLYNEYQVFSGGKGRQGRKADLSPPPSAVVKKE